MFFFVFVIQMNTWQPGWWVVRWIRLKWSVLSIYWESKYSYKERGKKILQRIPTATVWETCACGDLDWSIPTWIGVGIGDLRNNSGLLSGGRIDGSRCGGGKREAPQVQTELQGNMCFTGCLNDFWDFLVWPSKIKHGPPTYDTSWL